MNIKYLHLNSLNESDMYLSDRKINFNLYFTSVMTHIITYFLNQ